jgi:Arc/MetJ-type ribon-helix-helix transcriptional regulator
MIRTANVNISLSARERRWIEEGIASGRFASPKEAVHESLRRLFHAGAAHKPIGRSKERSDLAKGYRHTAAWDRKMAAEWSNLEESLPEK